MATEPKHPGALATDQELCEFWQAMDKHFDTPANSPLHHSFRCEIHGSHGPRKAPVVPPSRDISKRAGIWSEKFMVSQSYMWGRKDAGEQTDPNDDMRFCEAYADAYWRFNRHERSNMPCLSRALEIFREKGAL
jgi:hypothetical protein